jgi:hypothetical protein
MGGECSMYGRDERYKIFWLENLKERRHLEDLDVLGG